MEDCKESESRLLIEEFKWVVIILKKYAYYSYSQITDANSLLKGTISKVWNKYQEQSRTHTQENLPFEVDDGILDQITLLIDENRTLSIQTLQLDSLIE